VNVKTNPFEASNFDIDDLSIIIEAIWIYTDSKAQQERRHLQELVPQLGVQPLSELEMFKAEMITDYAIKAMKILEDKEEQE